MIVPPVISPAATPSAPRHSSSTTEPKIAKMINEVITARRTIRRREVSNVRSTAPVKRSASRPSWLKPWTIFIAPKTSVTIAPTSATRS